MPKRKDHGDANQEAAGNEVPPKRQKGTPHVPPASAGVHQGGGALSAEIEDLWIQEYGSMHDRLGKACGRVAPSTHRYILDRQIKPTFCRLLRLCYR